MNRIQRKKLHSRTTYSWSGTLFLWRDQSLYLGAASDSTPHATHDVTVCVALHGSFRLGTGAGWREFRAAIIPPDLPHIFDGRGAQIALFYFPSEALRSRRLLCRGAEPSDVPDKIRSRFLPRLHNYLDGGCGASEATELCQDFVRELARSDLLRLPLDSRIAHALEYFQSDPTYRFTAAEISSEVALSQGRFAHLFREQVGLPVRRYLLELRFRRALLQVADGNSLTAGAHAAGFADSAHLSRTFRRMTGIAPSSLLKHSRVIPAAK